MTHLVSVADTCVQSKLLVFETDLCTQAKTERAQLTYRSKL